MFVDVPTYVQTQSSTKLAYFMFLMCNGLFETTLEGTPDVLYFADRKVFVIVISMNFTLNGKPEFAEDDAGNGRENNLHVCWAWLVVWLWCAPQQLLAPNKYRM